MNNCQHSQLSTPARYPRLNNASTLISKGYLSCRLHPVPASECGSPCCRISWTGTCPCCERERRRRRRRWRRRRLQLRLLGRSADRQTDRQAGVQSVQMSHITGELGRPAAAHCLAETGGSPGRPTGSTDRLTNRHTQTGRRGGPHRQTDGAGRIHRQTGRAAQTDRRGGPHTQTDGAGRADSTEIQSSDGVCPPPTAETHQTPTLRSRRDLQLLLRRQGPSPEERSSH